MELLDQAAKRSIKMEARETPWIWSIWDGLAREGGEWRPAEGGQDDPLTDAGGDGVLTGAAGTDYLDGRKCFETYPHRVSILSSACSWW